MAAYVGERHSVRQSVEAALAACSVTMLYKLFSVVALAGVLLAGVRGAPQEELKKPGDQNATFAINACPTGYVRIALTNECVEEH